MSTGLVALILFGTLFLLFLLKMPIGFSLMMSSILVMVLTGTGLEMVPKRLFTACDSFAFMAVPFFILAGTLMSQGNAAVTSAPHAMLWPSIFISLLMISFNLFGNGLRDAFNPSMRGVED